MAWVNEANWPEAWTHIYFSPIVKSNSEYIVYATGYAAILKIYKYNLTMQTWTYLNTTPVQLYGAISMSPDGSKLAFHEANGNNLYIYNIAGNSWTTSVAAPNLSVTGETAGIQTTVWTDDDTIWCHIRDISGNDRSKCYKYVVSTDTWTQYTNVYTLGPYNNSSGMSVNTAGTALFAGKVSGSSDRTLGMKYVIATDTYSQISIGSGWDYCQSLDRSARLWCIDALTSYAGFKYFDCDTETTSDIIFPDDTERTKSSQALPCGIYGVTHIIAWHKTIEPKNRSYPDITLPSVTTNPATAVEATIATLNGRLDDDGSKACEVRFQYGETAAYGTNTDWQSGKVTGDTFEQVVRGLLPGRVYHFRAQARNSAGTANGGDRTFHTAALAAAAHQALGKSYPLSRAEV